MGRPAAAEPLLLPFGGRGAAKFRCRQGRAGSRPAKVEAVPVVAGSNLQQDRQPISTDVAIIVSHGNLYHGYRVHMQISAAARNPARDVIRKNSGSSPFTHLENLCIPPPLPQSEFPTLCILLTLARYSYTPVHWVCIGYQ